MFPWILGIGAVGLVIGVYRYVHHVPTEKTDPAILGVVNAIFEGRATPAQLDAAIELAKRSGQTKTADALVLAKSRLGATTKAPATTVTAQPIGTSTAVHGELIVGRVQGEAALAMDPVDDRPALVQIEELGRPVPIPDVGPEAWLAFVSRMLVSDPDTLDGERLGAFGMRKIRMRELGCSDVAGALGDVAQQYDLFCRDMARARATVLSKYGDALGKEIDGHPATLSGLMAVVRCAGIHGTGSWIASPEERKRFTLTSAFYERATGIF